MPSPRGTPRTDSGNGHGEAALICLLVIVVEIIFRTLPFKRREL